MFYHALTGNGGTAPVEDLEPVLLWENSNPSAEFAAQTVSLDLTDYAGVLVEFNSANDQLILATRSYLSKSDKINKDHFGAGHVGGSAGGIGRNYSINNSGVVFANAYYLNNVSNNAMIPTKIYGVKEYVVEPAVGDLLWHNDNPTTSLDLKELNGDYSKYSKILVKGRYSTTNNFSLESVVFKDSTHYSGLLALTVGAETSYRGVALTDTKITINTGFLFTSGTPTANNIYCIVTDIYGIE